MRFSQCFAILAAVLLFLAAPAAAQSTAGTITGIVTDAMGAAVPGASVTLTNVNTGVVTQTTTNESGVYVARSLLAGVYRLEARADGFKIRRVEGLTLQVGQELRSDVSLELGAVTETIEVQATVTPLKQETAEISDTYTYEEIQNMPINGRTPYSLLDLSAGLSSASDDPSNGDYANYVSINGGRPRGNNFTVDGATTTHIGGIGERVGSIEAISEFKLYSHTYSAEFGRTAGGIVSFQIRSGTQKFKGTAFEYHRNAALNANSWRNNALGLKAAKRRRHEFGGTFGGPVLPLRDQMFFFVSYEGWRDAQPQTRTKSIPDPPMRRGDFRSYPVVVNDPLTQSPFPGNIIPASRFDPVAAKVMELFPDPNTLGNYNSRYGIYTNNWVRPTLYTYPGNYIISRWDWNASSHDRLFLTFSVIKEGPRDQGRDFLNPLNTVLGPLRRTMLRSTFGYTRVLSPRMTSELLLHGQRDPRRLMPWYKDFDATRELGMARKVTLGVPVITISGLDTYGDSDIQDWVHQPAGGSEGISWLKGRHHMKFGAQLYQNQFWYISSGDRAGTYVFNGEITGRGAEGRNNPVNAVADLLLGTVKTANALIPQIPINRFNYNLGLYFHDVWKVNRRLTLNLGLRYEFELHQAVKNNVYSRIDPYTGDLLVAARNATRNLNLKNDYVNFGPRFGLAWLLDDRTVLRSGFAIFYSNFWMYNGEMVSYPGWTRSQTFTDLGVGRPQPFALRDGLPVEQIESVPDPFALYRAASQRSPLPVNSLSYEPKSNLPRTVQWNFGIQRALPWATTLEVSYVATRGTHLPRAVSGNSPRFEQAPLLVIDRLAVQAVRPYPAIANFNVLRYDATSIYHSLQTRAQRRFRNGFSLHATFTYSKNIDTASSVNDVFQIPWQFPEIERSLSSLDRPRLLSVGWMWNLPFGKRGLLLRNNRVASKVLGGFQVNGIFRAGDGRPRTILQNRTNLVLLNQRPDVLDPRNLSGKVSEPTYTVAARQWLIPISDPAFPFTPSGSLSLGNLGRNTTRMPGYYNFNLNLFRSFRLTERAEFQLRLEAYNATNHVNFQNVASLTIQNANYGLLNTTAAAREVQIGGRISF